MICKKNKLTHTHKNKLTHTRQTYQTIYTQMQNLEYNNVQSWRIKFPPFCFLFVFMQERKGRDTALMQASITTLLSQTQIRFNLTPVLLFTTT